MFKFTPEQAAKIEAAFQKAYDKLVENCGREKVEQFFGDTVVDEIMEESVQEWPRLCRQCKYSDDKDAVDLRCSNPHVNAKDSWALSSSRKYYGTSCRSERERTWFAACGRNGKLWEPKVYQGQVPPKPAPPPRSL